MWLPLQPHRVVLKAGPGVGGQVEARQAELGLFLQQLAAHCLQQFKAKEPAAPSPVDPQAVFGAAIASFLGW